MRKIFEKPELEIVKLEDVVTASAVPSVPEEDDTDNDLPWTPIG